MQCLILHSLFVKPEKCQFHATPVFFLSYPREYLYGLQHCLRFANLLSVYLKIQHCCSSSKDFQIPDAILVWTDHKNLEYISTAKTLNLRQVHWTLFFTCFNFALLLTFLVLQTSNLVSAVPAGILREKGLHLFFLSPAWWQPSLARSRRERSATESQTSPSACPPDHLFIPSDLRSEVLQWAHVLRLSRVLLQCF